LNPGAEPAERECSAAFQLKIAGTSKSAPESAFGRKRLCLDCYYFGSALVEESRDRAVAVTGICGRPMADPCSPLGQDSHFGFRFGHHAS